MNRASWRFGLILPGILSAMIFVACGGEEVLPMTYEVQVAGNPGDANLAVLAYFPNEVTVHAGDTIQFTLVDTGEPHTVTMGKLVDEGLEGVQEPSPEADSAVYQTLAGSLERSTRVDWLPELPLLSGIQLSGLGDVDQIASNDCFIPANGRPPSERCSVSLQRRRMGQPEFDGTQEFYNSGWMGPDVAGAASSSSNFVVKLSKDIELGTYRYLCLQHGTAMTGSIIVVDSVDEIPTPAEVKVEGEAQVDQMAAQLEGAVAALSTLDADTAQAGSGSPDLPIGLVNMFGPADLSIPVGGSVTWTVLGRHTISFNAPEDATPLRLLVMERNTPPEEAVRINEKTLAPANSPGQPPLPEGEAHPPGPPILIDGGTWDGEGFLNSGVIVSSPPQLFQYRLTFSTAGTYTYQCLIHSDMEGMVQVGS